MEREAKIGLGLAVVAGLLLALVWYAVLGSALPAGISGIAGAPTERELAPQEALDAFEEAGLPMDQPERMRPDALLNAQEGIRFDIPRGRDERGLLMTEVDGRVLRFASESDMRDARGVFETITRESGTEPYWIYEHENLLLRIDGELLEEEARRYEAALNSL